MKTARKQIFPTLLILSAVLNLSEQATLPEDPYYTAGVVEFRPSQAESSLLRLENNVEAYLDIIKSDEATSTDIIVFPESTLNNEDETTFVPDPNKESMALCDMPDAINNYSDFLVRLSCSAKNSTKYIVVNISEKELCSSVPTDPRPCADTGLNIYNTNVVFDRNGVVISRYRKVNLYGEQKNITFQPEYGMFDTDFGVRFGHFVCFDILFYTPAQEMADNFGIKDFILATMWFSQLPFLTGVQIQTSWSYGNDVNLLAAGASLPIVGTTGSGIYNGRRGALVSVMNQNEGERKLYVARVPKYVDVGRKLVKREIPTSKTNEHAALTDTKSIFLKRDYLQNYNSILLDFNTESNSLEHDLCYENSGFCCHFELNWRTLNAPVNSTYYTYRLGVFDGYRNEVAAEVNKIKNCALFACVNSDIMQCGTVLRSNETELEIRPQVTFERIVIEAEYPIVPEYVLMPNSLKDDDLLPVAVENFEWSEIVINEDTTHKVRYVLNTTTDNLLAFAIYGNYFDEPEISDNGGAAHISAMAMSALLILVACIAGLI